MTSRKKAGCCKCGHEIRYWHDPETGECMHGQAWRGHPASPTGVCGCVRKVKARKPMKTNERTTKAVTLRASVVLEVLDGLIGAARTQLEAFEKLRREVGRLKTSGNLLEPMVGESETALPSRRAEAPKSAAPKGSNGAAHTTPFPIAGGAPSSGARAVLTAVAQGFTMLYELVVATGYAERTVQNHLAELSALGLVDRGFGEAALTPEGRAEFPGGTPDAPTETALVAACASRLGESERACFLYIVEERSCSLSDLVDHTGLAERTAQNILGELARRRLVRRSRGRATLAHVLGGPS